MASLYRQNTGSKVQDTASEIEIERETNKVAFTEAANAAKDLPKDEFKSLLIQELKQDTGVDLSSNEYKYQSLLNEASAAQAGQMARACSATGDTKQCNIEDDSFIPISGTKNWDLRRRALKELVTRLMKSCQEANLPNVRSCAETQEVKDANAALNGDSQFDRLSREAAGELASKMQMNCLESKAETQDACIAKATTQFNELTTKDLRSNQRIETYEGARAREAMRSVMTSKQCSVSSSDQCTDEMKSNIRNLNYPEHSSGIVALMTATTAGAQAWADATADEKTEEERVAAAEAEFTKFASKSLFDKANVQRLAEAKKSGEATHIWKSKDMVTTMLNLKAPKSGGCTEVASQVDNVRKLILSAANISPTDNEAMSIARAEASDKSGCDVIFRTKVDAGKVGEVSKEITTRYERDIVRRRRLGGGGSSAQISSGASEEEVKFGDKPTWTDFSNSDTSENADDTAEDAEDGEEDGDFQTFLNSSAMHLECDLVVMALTLSLGVLAAMF